MAIKRVVSTEFWEDERVINEYTPEDKYFLLYLLTNPHCSLLGVYRLVPRQAAFEMGYSTDAVKALLERFEHKYANIQYAPDTCEVAIRNYLKHGIVKGGPPVLAQLLKEAAAVKDKSLLQYVLDANRDNPNQTVREFMAALGAPSAPGTNGNGDGNGDGNGYGYGESGPIRKRTNTPSFIQTNHEDVTAGEKKPRGQYNNVLLTDVELDTLKAELPDWQARVDRLSEYIESKGDKYKSHLATIRAWARQDKQAGSAQAKKTGFHAYDQDSSGPDTAGPDLLAEARASHG